MIKWKFDFFPLDIYLCDFMANSYKNSWTLFSFYRSKISHLIPQEIPLSEPILNLHEFHGSFKFMAWTPSGNILQIQLSENDIHQELVWDSSEKKQYLGEDICYFYDQKYSRILTEFCFCLLFWGSTLKYQNIF